MIRTAGTLLGSNLGIAALKFIRNILLARLLGIDDFGIASTFAIVFAMFEMVGFLGLDRLLVQARDGNEPRVQATLHTMQVLRGAFMALAQFALAGPLAHVMGVPDVAWAFRVMALIPLVQGFVHLDMTRLQRDMRFGLFIKANIGAELAGVLAIYPMFLVFGDYRVALWTILLQQIMATLLSHTVAERRFSLGFERDIFMRALSFGWPLLLNAILMFGIFQGDRIVVANRLGVAELGLFSLAFMLTFMPTNILAQTINRLFLPKLARLQDDPPEFQRLAVMAVEAGLVVGLAVAAGFAIFGADMVKIVFGSKYDAALGLLVWLAVMQAVRIAKMGVSLVAVARAETRSPIIANGVRVLFLPVAWLALSWGADLRAVAWIAILGEGLGLMVSFHLLRSWLGVPVRPFLRPVLIWTAVLLLICVDTALNPPSQDVLRDFHWLQALVVFACGVAFFSMSGLRSWIIGRMRRT